LNRPPGSGLPSARSLVAEMFDDEASDCPFDRERVFGPRDNR
jgi:hypothetical protein